MHAEPRPGYGGGRVQPPDLAGLLLGEPHPAAVVDGDAVGPRGGDHREAVHPDHGHRDGARHLEEVDGRAGSEAAGVGREPADGVAEPAREPHRAVGGQGQPLRLAAVAREVGLVEQRAGG